MTPELAEELLLHKVRIVADFELYGENEAGDGPIDAELWIARMLDGAKDQGLIDDYKVTGIHENGPFALQFIQFYIEVFQAKDEWENARLLGASLLSEHIFHDKVNVRFASIVGQA